MSELEQLSISKLNNFFVDYMLSLVHAVEAASSCLIEFEVTPVCVTLQEMGILFIQHKKL
jgi:hypothetical protein